MTTDHETPFHVEISPFSFAELSIELRKAGHAESIGDDGKGGAMIRLGLARIGRARPPKLDNLGGGVQGDE